MSAKFTASRRDAFIRALTETGNQTLSAERVKVSRSWVCLHRSTDPGFDAACRAAIAAAAVDLRSTSSRLAQDRLNAGAKEQSSRPPHLTSPSTGRGSNRPPSGWGFLDGAELVVRGSNGRRVQIGRARIKQWTPRVEDRFLRALSATCNVKAACAEVGMHAPSAYAHRHRWPAFAERWDQAIETGYARIELALVEKACNLFSAPEVPPEAPLGPMTAAQAIHILHMHKNQVRGAGKKPGKRRRPRTLDEVRDSILRKIEAIERGREVGEADKARDEREWARRRPLTSRE